MLVQGPLPQEVRCQDQFTQVGIEAFHSARIEAGFPLYGTDFGHENLPQEIGRDAQAISFTKGCYLGQETVARIDALGHVNRRLVGVRFTTTSVPQPPLELRLDEAVVGHVTSTAYSPRLKAPLGLAIVRREASEPGAKLASLAGECEVQSLPATESS